MVVSSYFYRDTAGNPVRVDRVEPGWHGRTKEFLPYASDGRGAFRELAGLNGARLRLYRDDEIGPALATGTIYITEGEGKCDRLRAEIRRAGDSSAVTTIQGGATAPFRPDHIECLKGAVRVVVIADSDEPGRRAARSRAQRIADANSGCEVRVVDLYPERNDGADAADWLADGHTLAEFATLVAAAPPVARSPMADGSHGATEERGDARSQDHKPRLDIVRLGDVPAEQVEWIWHRRIPIGKVTLLVGDPGAGKSFASLAIAASITTGTPLPDDDAPRSRGKVLLWNGEDGIEDTIRPRADAVGVDVQRAYIIRGSFDDRGQPRPFSLADVARLYDMVEQLKDVAAIFIDPVSVLLAGVDTHRDAEVRSTLQPLVELARSARVAVVVVLHLKKGEAERILYRVGGSIGFVALARSVLLVGTDDDGRRAIAPVKSNLCAAPSPVEFHIDDEGHWWWLGANDDLSAEQLLAVRRAEPGEALRAAIGFLEEALASGERDVKEVTAEAASLGITVKTLERARKKLGVKARRVGGAAEKGRWLIRLPKGAKNASDGSDVDGGLSGEGKSP